MRDKLKKLTVFDYLLVALFFIGVLFFAVTFLRRPEYVNITVKIGEDDVSFMRPGSRDWFAQLFTVGMTERDGAGKPQVEVTKVFRYDSDKNKQAVYLTMKVHALYTKSTMQYSYKGKPLLVGYPIKLQLDYINTEGIITNIDKIPDRRVKKELMVETQIMIDSTFMETTGTRDYIADALNVGDTISDSEGNPVMTIVAKRTLPAKKVVTTSQGEVLTRFNPLLKDIFLTLKINATMINNKYYLFDDIPILIGQSIPLSTSKIYVGPVVTKITESENQK